MTTDAAFLQAILDNPDDDGPRLVYADWLDEQGDHDRAEFIRVQCELARLDEIDHRRDDLERRERELLERHEPQWLGELPESAVEWSFHRGFLEQITTGVQTFIQIGVPVTVRSLRVVTRADSTPCESMRLLLSHQAARLLELNVIGHLTGPDIEAMTSAPLLERLRKLTVLYYSLDEQHPRLAEFHLLQGLQSGSLSDVSELELDSSDLTFGSLRRLAEAEWAERWTGIKWNCSGMDVSAGDSVDRLGACTNLRRLHVPDWPSRSEFPSWPNLTHLRVKWPATPSALRHLTKADFLPNLLRLDLTLQFGTGTELCRLITEILEHLRPSSLYLRTHLPAANLIGLARDEPTRRRLGGLSTQASPTLLRALAEGPPWVALTDLDLMVSRARVGDALAELLHAPVLPRLRRLSLFCHHFSDEAALALAQSPALSSLRELQLHTGQVGRRVAPRLADWLGLAHLNRLALYVPNGRIFARPLAESPNLSPLTSLFLSDVGVDSPGIATLRQRLGHRLQA